MSTDPELGSRAQRRNFTAAEKATILAESFLYGNAAKFDRFENQQLAFCLSKSRLRYRIHALS